MRGKRGTGGGEKDRAAGSKTRGHASGLAGKTEDSRTLCVWLVEVEAKKGRGRGGGTISDEWPLEAIAIRFYGQASCRRKKGKETIRKGEARYLEE